jgi:hypothetical protein
MNFYSFTLSCFFCSGTECGAPPRSEGGKRSMEGNGGKNIARMMRAMNGDFSEQLSSEKRAAIKGSNRVKRGGSWNNNAQNCRSANRNNNTPSNRNNNLGFRLTNTIYAEFYSLRRIKESFYCPESCPARRNPSKRERLSLLVGSHEIEDGDNIFSILFFRPLLGGRCILA